VVDEFIPIASLLFPSERIASPRGSQEMRVIVGCPQCFKLADQQIQPFAVKTKSNLGVLRIFEFDSQDHLITQPGNWQKAA
jgi:hypothetical protein